MQELQNYDKGKSVAHNKLKLNQSKVPPNKWQLSHEFLNNKIVSYLSSGSSTEICLAKFIAFKRNYVFGGCKQLKLEFQANYVEDTVKFIE